MGKCYFCKTALTETNISKEHVIPNALGGRITLKDFICNRCNDTFFHKIDVKIAKDFETFANMLDIKRDNGKPVDINGECKGKKYNIKSSGNLEHAKPTIEIKKTADHHTISIEARNKGEAENILKGLKKKYTKLDVEEWLGQIETKREYLDDVMHFKCSFSGGVDSFRAFAKIVLWTLRYRCPDFPINTLKIFSFMIGEMDFKEYYYFFPDAPLVMVPDNKIYHSIFIKSYPQEKLLVGFIDLYNVISAVMILSDNYEQDFESHYIFDILETKEVVTSQVNYPLLSKVSLDQLFRDTPPITDQLKSRIGRFLEIARKRQQDAHINELIERALAKSLGKYPAGTTITQEMMDETNKAVMEEITPWLHHNMNRKHKK